MLPPAVAGDVVVCCVLVVVTILAVLACDVAGVLTVGTLSVISREGVEETRLLGTVELAVVGVVVVF